MTNQHNPSSTDNHIQQPALRALPSMTALLEHPQAARLQEAFPRSAVVTALQQVLAHRRDALRTPSTDTPTSLDTEAIIRDAHDILRRAHRPSLVRVINATGVVLHTGLGRAPLPQEAVDAIARTAGGYCNVEMDLGDGTRGWRPAHVSSLLARLCGAEAATVVNNNAAATMLILAALARGKEVAISRGQLVEIGGSYRLPDVMATSGAIMREVGTTNRTHLHDYERAITSDMAMLLKVHTSNYKITGFATSPTIGEMAGLAKRHGLLCVDDVGSGSLIDLQPYGLLDEPVPRHSIEAGADLVCFSADKLLGGPQAGVIAGKAALISQLETHPLMRAFRVDKLTLLALQATLQLYISQEVALQRVPALAMLTAPPSVLAARADKLAQRLHVKLPNERFFVCSDVAPAGGGSLPGVMSETVVVQWQPRNSSCEEVVSALRAGEPSVVARVRQDHLCFDLRTVRDDELEQLVTAVVAVANVTG